MLMIRLQRTGRKHEPTFRVVLTDSKNGPKSGKYHSNLGWYDTRRKNSVDQLDIEQIKSWLAKGAKPSVTLHNFLVANKVITGKKLNALPKKKPIKKEEAPVAEAAPVSETPTPAAETKAEEKVEEKAEAKPEAAVPAAEAAPVTA